MRWPTGTVTFLLTDVEGSTRLLERQPREMRAAIDRHDALAAEIIARCRGVLVRTKGEGDSLFAVFARATDAVEAACTLQRAFVAEPWPTSQPIRVRMALHVGEVERRGRDYFGGTIHRCARIRALTHGGQILLSQAVEEVVRSSLPAGVTLSDLGEHPLRDIERPERLFQLRHHDLPTDFPALQHPAPRPVQLPLPLSSFVGREKERNALVARLISSAPRLLTLTGPAGAGKTRLALASASDAVERGAFPDGAAFVDLTRIVDPLLVPQAIAGALKVREEEPARPLLETLGEALSGQSLLLVLDNCEHLLDTCAECIEHLLKLCPRLVVLATSRKPLGISGESVVRVSPLPLPDEGADSETLLQSAAVRLFLERTQEVTGENLPLTPGDLARIVAICRRLDGLPLAIELVAAKADVLSLPEIEARLYSLVKSGGRRGPERHRGLNTLLDWSYDLLGAPERALLARLPVFSGGWTLEAAEAVCAETSSLPQDEVLNSLSALVRISLVAAEDGPNGHRYHLLETLREYARQKLDAQDEDLQRALRERHARFFFALVERGERELVGQAQKEWVARLEADISNIRSALGHLLGTEKALQMASGMRRFWEMRGSITEARKWIREALCAAPGDDGRTGTLIRARALHDAGTLAASQADYSEGERLLGEALMMRQLHGDRHGTAATLNNLGDLRYSLHDYPAAQRCYEAALDHFRAREDIYPRAVVLRNLGKLCVDTERLREARAYLEEAAQLFDVLGDASQAALARMGIGMILQRTGNNGAARTLLEEAVEVFREVGNRPFEASALTNLAETLVTLGDMESALSAVQRARAIHEETGHRSSIYRSLMLEAALLGRSGRLEEAAHLLGEADAEGELAGVEKDGSGRSESDAEMVKLRAAVADRPDLLAGWKRGHQRAQKGSSAEITP